jgi:hypothetical protein
MAEILAHPTVAEQAPPALSDARAAAVIGLALSNARLHLSDSIEMALTAGAQFDAAREVARIVLGKAAEIEPGMSVTALLNLIETGRR